MLEWLKTILGEHYTDEVDKQVSAEIGKAFVSKTDFNTKNDALKTAQATITELEKSKGDTAALQKQLDDYKAAEDKRKADETAAAARAAIEARFNAVLGEKKFASDYTRKGVLEDFAARMADEANKGKGDAEIFKAITENDKGVLPGLFASANPPAGGMGGVGGAGGNDNKITARDEIKKQLFGGN